MELARESRLLSNWHDDQSSVESAIHLVSAPQQQHGCWKHEQRVAGSNTAGQHSEYLADSSISEQSAADATAESGSVQTSDGNDCVQASAGGVRRMRKPREIRPGQTSLTSSPASFKTGFDHRTDARRTSLLQQAGESGHHHHGGHHHSAQASQTDLCRRCSSLRIRTARTWRKAFSARIST